MQDGDIFENSYADSENLPSNFILPDTDHLYPFIKENDQSFTVTVIADTVIKKLIAGIDKSVITPEYLRTWIGNFIEALRRTQHEWADLDHQGRIQSFDDLLSMIREFEVHYVSAK